MNKFTLSTANNSALVGGILVFLATFFDVAKLNEYSVSVSAASFGIWDLLPILGIAGIITSGLAMQGKMNIRLSSQIIGLLTLVIGSWYLGQGTNFLESFAAAQANMAGGFNSPFFTGKHVDVSSLHKADAGLGSLMYLVGALLFFVSGFLSKSPAKVATTSTTTPE